MSCTFTRHLVTLQEIVRNVLFVHSLFRKEPSRWLVMTLLLWSFLSVCGQKAQSDMPAWKAGEALPAATVTRVGADSFFSAAPIPDSVWGGMQGYSYQENPYIGRSDLRYVRVLHYDREGTVRMGELVCNKLIAHKLVEIFRQLYEARYPIQRMVLPDVYGADDERQMRANNSSCFCFRTIAKSGRLSKHARGLAVDLNPLYNPYYKDGANGKRFVQPSTGVPYCDRSKKFPYKIDRNDLAYKLFTKAGFEWGGAWRSCKDFQHFEWME